MRKGKPLPSHCLTVHTYQELRAIVLAFARGSYQLLCIMGSPGAGKSEMVTRLMQEILGPSRWGLIKGKHSPLDLYERVYHFRTFPIVFDDLDDLLQKVENVMLLKCLCDTCPVKQIQWGSNHPLLSGGSLPKSYEAISRVCLICNDWNALDRNIGAVYDRGVVSNFQPSALEVHREIARAGWFDDEEALTFIGQNLFLVTEPSFRFYQIARDHKRAGLDWKSLVLRTIEANRDPKLILVARLMADSQYEGLPTPETAREQAFKDAGAGSRATYHRFKAELLAKRGAIDPAVVESIKLQPYKPDLRYLAMLDRRNQLELAQEDTMDGPADDEDQVGSTAASDEPLSGLRKALNEAIRKEDYSEAAKLRDQIRRLEQG